MIKLLRYLTWKEWLLFVVLIGVVVGQVFIDLALPDYMGEIVSLIQFGATSGDIWIVGAKMLGLAVGSVACAVAISFIASLVSSTFSKNLRRELFTKVNSFSMEEINKFSTASLITRSTNDITQVQNVVSMLMRFAVSAPIMIICTVIKIIGKSGTLSWITALAIVAMLCLMLTMFLVVVPKFKVIQNKTDKLNSVTRENLTGLKVIRAFNAENYQENKFENVNQGLTKTNLFVNRVSSIMFPGMSLIMNGLCLAIMWVGAYLIAGNSLSLANMTVFTQYAMILLINFLMFSMLFVMVPRASISGRRINEVLTTKNKILDGDFESDSEKHKAKIQFKNVCFSYPNSEEYILKDINFTAKAGETVAFVGSTGSGKSTLINLVPRFYDVTKGQILIDGKDIKEYTIENLNNKLGYVPQRSTLFMGSIKDNVLYGKNDATDEEVDKALEIAQAKSFVNKLDEKMDFEVSQGGKNLSGGQGQRLSIARAVVKNPEIYIFDDSFSALDFKTDSKLRKALAEATKDSISMIVAQRIGTIINADKIIVLEKGEIVGQGTHKELLKTCDVYKEIALSQFTEKELRR